MRLSLSPIANPQSPIRNPSPLGRCTKIALMLLVALGLTLGLAACSAVPRVPADWRDQLPPRLADLPLLRGEEVTFIPLTVWAWSEGEGADGWLTDQISAFVTANPTVSVTVALPADYADRLDNLLDGQLDPAEIPDVILLDLFRLPQFIDAGLVQALPADRLSADDLYPLLRGGSSAGGQLYCLPFEFNTLALLYNRALFDQAGINYPSATWTWADLEQAATAISGLPTDRFTAYGLVLPADVTRWLPFLNQAGGLLLDATGAPALDPLVAGQVISTYVELVTAGPAVDPGYLEAGWSGEALGIGRVGMALEGNWAIPYLDNEHPEIDYGVAPLPVGAAGASTLAFGSCWAVLNSDAGASHDAAFALLAQLTTPGALEARLAHTAAVPARPSLAESWRLRHPELDAFLDSVAFAQLWQLPAEFERLPRLINRELRAVFDGDQTAQEAQAEIRARMEELVTPVE